jgi:hypothetical protein
MTIDTAKKKETKIRPLTPAAARREIAALERLLEDGDIGIKAFWDLKMDVLARLGAGHE